VRVTIEQRTVRLRRPIATAYGTLTSRELFELAIEWADGVRGRGEAAPLEHYDGVSAQRARAALEAYSAVLEDGDGLDGGELL
jgi:L-alanine-DL-glutamate epimerase-like enolase superfamily enzyme